MANEDQDEIRFTADDLGIDEPLTGRVGHRLELAQEFQHARRTEDARAGQYVGEDLEKALVRCAELLRATD